ncbi:MAG: exonuclease SbcCD subunit D [Gammaproteobacteria bacterium]|nr:exonuclease SbcCD subunit D [Gammaproteobacteria bacterium]
MRFLHTSDWHLGRYFHNVSLIEDQRHVLHQIIAMVQTDRIDAVLIAGDIFDRALPPTEAMTLLEEFFHQVADEQNVPIILIAGNHDQAQRLSFGSRLFAHRGVHILTELSQEPKPVLLNDEHGEVAFFGIPYADPVLVRDQLDADVQTHERAMAAITQLILPQIKPTQRSVILAHCFIDGSETSDSERTLSLGGAERIPYELFDKFHYTALGHLHGPQFRGKETIRYSGSPLKYSFSEVTQNKSVSIVDINETGHCEVEKRLLSPLRDMRIIEGTLESIIEKAKEDPNPQDYLLVRLMDKQALYDPMSKLRVYYPNVLQLEKPFLHQTGERQTTKRENLKKGELPMFQDFYQQMTGDTLNKEAEELVSTLLERIHQGEVV